MSSSEAKVTPQKLTSEARYDVPSRTMENVSRLGVSFMVRVSRTEVRVEKKADE